MRADPDLDPGRIAACLATRYEVQAATITFLPVGHLSAAAYMVVAADGMPFFLKVKFGPLNEPGLRLSSALVDLGLSNILAPIPTRSSEIWAPLDGYPDCPVVLFPFIRGQNAKAVGLTHDQWRAFGSTLRAIHDSNLEERFRGVLPRESFALPSAATVRRLLAPLDDAPFESRAAQRFGTFWREHAGRIAHLLARAEELGRRLQARSLHFVVCHGDIHTANVLVGDDGQIFLVDWDGPPDPLIAPIERDLLFVVGSRIARTVEPREEDRFFEGYGPASVDPVALAYFRYERIVQDIGDCAEGILLNPGLSEEERADEADLAMAYFAAGGPVETAEMVARTAFP